MAITTEEMKERIVDNEINYIREMVNRDRYDDLFEFVYQYCFNDFKSMNNEEIKEQYEWRFFDEEQTQWQ